MGDQKTILETIEKKQRLDEEIRLGDLIRITHLSGFPFQEGEDIYICKENDELVVYPRVLFG